MSNHAYYLLQNEDRIWRFIDNLKINHPDFLQDLVNIGNSLIAIILSTITIGFIIISQLNI